MADAIVTGVRATAAGAVQAGSRAQLTAFVGPLTAANVSVAGAIGGASASAQTGVAGMYSGWFGQIANAPLVIGVQATATATAQPGTVTATSASVAVVGAQAFATADAFPGSVLQPLSRPVLLVEIDFTGNPTAPLFDQVSQQTGVVSYWRMSDTATILDHVDANNLAVTGAPTLVTGPLPFDTDQALRFDGTSQYATAPSSSGLNQAGSYTMAGWIKFPSLPGSLKVIVSKGNYRLHITPTSRLSFAVTNDQNGTLTNTTVTTNSPLTANTWYHVVAVHDATEDELRIYLNGVLDNTASHSVGTELHSTRLHFAGIRNVFLPAFRASSTAGSPAASNQSLFVIPTPSYAQGDLMVAQINFSDSTTFPGATLTAPAGWNLIANTKATAGQLSGQMFVFYKFAAATEPASYTWTCSITTGWDGGISTHSGVDPLAPFANPVYSFYGGPTQTTNSHLATAYNTYALALFAGGNTSGVWSAGWTARYIGTGNNASPIYLASRNPAYEETISASVAAGSLGVRHAVLLMLNGTGIGSYTAVDMDEWSFWSVPFDAQDALSQYDATSSGVGSWVDVSADARGANTKYGRQYELNRMEAGSAGLVLKNQHRNYDPANTSSPYAPNVKPNRRVRVRAQYKGTTYQLFEGLIERWPSNWGIAPNYDEVNLVATDGFKALNRAGIDAAIARGLSGTQIETALSRALYPIDARDIDTGEFILAANTTADTVSALSVIQDASDSELGIFFINHATDDSPATFHDRSHRWTTTRSLEPQATFADDGAGIYYQDLVPSDDDDNMANEWIVTSANGTEGIAVDVVSQQQNYTVTGTRSTRLDNPADADDQARALLQQTSRPGLRFDSLRVRLTPQTDEVTWRTLLGLAISDRVTVKRNPVPGAGGSVIVKTCFIEGIGWDITPNYWDVSYQLSPIATMPYSDVIVLDGPVSYWRMDETV